jgi:hypothetical protein
MDEAGHLPAADAAGDSPLQARGAGQETGTELGEQVRRLLKWVYTNNPFYVLSAWLVFLGLRLSFDTTADTFQTGALMLGLTGYTTLLAASACFLVRVGKVWEDVRSMLVLVVLMCLAISVCFDETLAGNPRVGTYYYLGGLVFSVLVSEGLLFGMPLRLPAGFRIPYYLVLALFFLYPIGLSPFIYDSDDPRLQWGLFGFSTAAGVLFLTLLPAVRRGPAYVRDNGSPWPWPWYPWVLFGTLALGVLGRAYYLCISLHFVGGSTNIFAPYFWVPFLLALNVVFLEITIVARHKAAMTVALVAPVVTVALAITGQSSAAVNLEFPDRFCATLGATPLYLTLIATSAFYVLCVLRRVPHGADALSLCLALFSACGPATANLASASLTTPRAFPFILIAAVQFGTAIRQRSVVRCTISAVCVLAGVAISLQGAPSSRLAGLVLFHVALGIVLLVGTVLRDRFGTAVQYVGAALIALAGVASVVCRSGILGDQPSASLQMFLGLYPLLAIATAAAYGCMVRNRWYFLSAAGILSSWLAAVTWHAYRGLRQTMAGLDYLFFGVLFFLIAMLISLNKARILRLRFRGHQNENGNARERGSDPDT